MKKPTQKTFQFFFNWKNYYYLYLFIFFTFEKNHTKPQNFFKEKQTWKKWRLYTSLFYFFQIRKKIIPNQKMSSKKSKRAIQNEVFVPFYFFFKFEKNRTKPKNFFKENQACYLSIWVSIQSIEIIKLNK